MHRLPRHPHRCEHGPRDIGFEMKLRRTSHLVPLLYLPAMRAITQGFGGKKLGGEQSGGRPGCRVFGDAARRREHAGAE